MGRKRAGPTGGVRVVDPAPGLPVKLRLLSKSNSSAKEDKSFADC